MKLKKKDDNSSNDFLRYLIKINLLVVIFIFESNLNVRKKNKMILQHNFNSNDKAFNNSFKMINIYKKKYNAH